MDDIEALIDQVAKWANEEGWATTGSTVKVAEAPFGEYSAPSLIVRSSWGDLRLEPVGRNVLGAKGRVDLIAYPSGDRVMLLRSLKDDVWKIKTDSILLREPWNKETFLWLSKALYHPA